MKALFILLPLVVVTALGCGQTVKSIDLSDENVPLDARRFVADAQDAVSIARARKDDAMRDLEFARAWRNDLLNAQMWPKGSKPTLDKLQEFTAARVRMFELQYEIADRRLDLAEAKYTLSTAETAMRNDLAVYDLEPLRADTEVIRDDLERLAGQLEDQRITLDTVSQQWWRTYKEFMGSNKSPAFYVSPELLADIKATQAERKKMQAEQAAKSKDDEKSDSDESEPKKDTPQISEEDKIDLDL